MEADEDKKDKLTSPKNVPGYTALPEYLLKSTLLGMCQAQGSGCQLAAGSSSSIWKQLLFKQSKVEEGLNFPLSLMSSDFY